MHKSKSKLKLRNGSMIEKKNLNLEKPILKTWSSESHFMSMILGMEVQKIGLQIIIFK